MPHTLVIHAHPRPGSSLITDAMRKVFEAQPDTELRPLYDLYPDFDIDVAAEQRALLAADLIVWLTPVHWYSVPALMKHWFDQVLTYGWAYGPGGEALRGKTAWWVTSAGATASEYAPGGGHGRAFADFLPPIEHTARFCGMHWLPPYVVHGGHANTVVQVSACCGGLQQRLERHLGEIAATGATA